MVLVNKVIIVGNLGKDLEVCYMVSGEVMCNIMVVISENWKDKVIGEKKELIEWYCILFFGKLVEICGQYLKKGLQVYVEGSIWICKWIDKDGQECYIIEICGDEMKMFGLCQGMGGLVFFGGGGGYDNELIDYVLVLVKNKLKFLFDDFGDDILF